MAKRIQQFEMNSKKSCSLHKAVSQIVLIIRRTAADYEIIDLITKHNSMKYRKKCIDICFLIFYILCIANLINTIRGLCTMSKSFFLGPTDPMQKRYEALRASFVDELSAEEVSNRFGYSIHTINALRRDFKTRILPPFFRPLTKGPKQRRPSTLTAKDRIVELRKQNYSIGEIEEVLLRERYDITAKKSTRF